MKTWTEQEVRAMYVPYAKGATLEQVAAQYELTIERVRQLYDQFGLRRRSNREMAATRHQELMAEAEAQAEHIIDLYKTHGSIEAVAERVDLPRPYLALIIDRIPNREAFRYRGKREPIPRSKLINDIKRAAADQGEPLTLVKYREAARRLKLAAPDTQVRAFGTLTEAFRAAGVQGQALTRQRNGVITDEQCIEAVVACFRDFQGHRQSFNTYDSWAKDNRRPSGMTVRKKLGTWNQAAELALARLD